MTVDKLLPTEAELDLLTARLFAGCASITSIRMNYACEIVDYTVKYENQNAKHMTVKYLEQMFSEWGISVYHITDDSTYIWVVWSKVAL